MLSAIPMSADTEIEGFDKADTKSEFGNEESVEYGVINSIVENMANTEATPADKPNYGAKLTDYASTPKFGGYFIGKYAYSSDDAQNAKAGFSQRLVRFYVDGKILNDFTYRFQLQTNNASFHMKDFFIEWGKYKEFKDKIGQYKRAFGFENPMNPWDVGVGDYSQVTKKFTGHADMVGESASTGGRDQGIQVQGDLFPVGKDKHRLIHYQLMVANGQGINTADANSNKDLIGTIQVQPVKGLFIGFFGWDGQYVSGNETFDRERYMISAKYDWNNWTFRTEYAHSNGHTEAGKFKNDGNSDGFYATVGVPCTPWLKTYVKYDTFRDGAVSDNAKTIYSVAPNFQLHKNLMFQLQYNYVNDKFLDKNYSEFWLETYVRF